MVDKARKSQLRLRSSDEPKTLNPNRLTIARKRKGLTKIGLADKLKIDRKSVHAYEAGLSVPSEETMARIVSFLGFPSEFFVGDDLEEPNLDSGSFRSMSKMTAPQRDMALSQVALCLELNAWLTKRFKLPEPRLPDLSREATPEAAAEYVRRDWGLGTLSIRNMVHLLEAKGVRVFSLSVDARQIDAFSMWHGPTPFVFLNTNKTAEHSRFDAAHELGHLVLHKHGPPRGLEAEKQANAFASAFLMPKGSILANATRFPTYQNLANLKRVWSVSVGALAYRLHDVGLMTEWQYRGICIEIAKRGVSYEPNPIQRETSMVLPKLFSSLFQDGLTRSQIARELTYPLIELEQLLCGSTMSGIDGGASTVATKKVSTSPQLRLVRGG